MQAKQYRIFSILIFIFLITIVCNYSPIIAQTSLQSPEYTFERKKITLKNFLINNKSTTITIEIENFEDEYTVYPYFDPNDPLYSDPNNPLFDPNNPLFDPNHISALVVKDPNGFCCNDKELTEALLFNIGIFHLPTIQLEDEDNALPYVFLSFSFNPPLEVNFGLIRYYTCEYNEEQEELIWDNISHQNEYLMGDRGKITIELSDYIGATKSEDGTIKPGNGDKNKEKAIIEHTGGFILLSDTSKGRCFIMCL